MTWISMIFVALAAAFGAGLGTEAVRRFTLRRSILDVPNERSSHDTAMPRGGGVAIVVACAIGWVWALVTEGGEGLAVLAGTALGITVVSAVDDIRSLTARTRFAVHFLAAGALVAGLGAWTSVKVPFFGGVPIGLLGVPLAVVWAVGLTNAYNFMDGTDGIAASQAVVAGLGWAVTGGLLGAPGLALTGALVAGGSVGFLVHNWSPARIFMGDVGSAFLGSVFAGLGVLAGGERMPLAALLFVWPFVFDAVLTFVRRLRSGEDVFAAHRSHLYQRLVIAGWSHRAVAGLYAVLAVGTSTSGVVWAVYGVEIAAVVGLVLPICLVPWVQRAESRRPAAA